MGRYLCKDTPKDGGKRPAEYTRAIWAGGRKSWWGMMEFWMPLGYVIIN